MSDRSLKGRRRIRRFLMVAPIAVTTLGASASAQAAEPGVTFDPGSPAGKEYAIPLAQGRADGMGTDNQRAAATTPFGVGITPPGGRDGGKGGAAGRHRRGTDGGSPPGPTGGTGRDRSDLRNRIAQADEPGGTELWTLGIALAVVVGAALLAVALRRRGEQAVG
jgi:hypothetical protein